MPSFAALGAIVVAVLSNATPISRPRTIISRAFDASDPYANWPSYDQLPLDPSFPTKAAWGVWVRLNYSRYTSTEPPIGYRAAPINWGH